MPAVAVLNPSSNASGSLHHTTTPQRPRDVPHDFPTSANKSKPPPANPFQKTASSSNPVKSTQLTKIQWEERIREFYQQHNPSKLSELSHILEKYDGREEELLHKLQKQYHVSSV